MTGGGTEGVLAPEEGAQLRLLPGRSASTSAAAPSAWSSPTPPAAVRCPCSSRPWRKGSASRAAFLHRGGRPGDPRADGRRRHCRHGRPTSPHPTVNHAWWEDDTFARVGRLGSELVHAALRRDGCSDAIDVRINRLVVESDVTLIIGPVLPHEVIGFSGGNKYLFPGLSGQEMIDVTHWLGALITSSEIIGTPRHHARARAGRCGSGAGARRAARAVRGGGPRTPAGCSRSPSANRSERGPPRQRSPPRPTCSTSTRPVQRVLSLVPPRYPDLWTGAKGFYKVEPIVADGGEVVLYAPHITEIAAMHPRLVEHRLPLPRLLPGALGALPRCPPGRAGALDAPLRRGHVRPRCGRTPAGARHPGDRDPRGHGQAGEPGLPRARGGRRLPLGLGPADVGRARRRRGALPASVGHRLLTSHNPPRFSQRTETRGNAKEHAVPDAR